MTDEALRGLEREVARSGKVEARLALANALERAGREVEAYDGLLAHASEPAVRAWLARWPIWNGELGGAGGTRGLDVPAVVSSPRVDLLRAAPDPPIREARLRVASSELLVLAETHDPRGDPTRDGTTIIDPRTGATRWRISLADAFPGSPAWWAWCGLVSDHGRRWDGHTGEELPRAGFPQNCFAWAVCAQGVLLRGSHGDRFFASLKLMTSPHADASWVFVGEKHRELSLLRASPTSIALVTTLDRANRLEALDPETGALLWVQGWSTAGNVLMDERGIVVADRTRIEELALVDGAHRWSRGLQEPMAVQALGADVVVVSLAEHGAATLRAIDRRDGAVGASLGTLPGRIHWNSPIAVARHVVYWAEESRLHATTNDGRELWCAELGPHGVGTIRDLAVGPGRVWVVGEHGAVALVRERP